MTEVRISIKDISGDWSLLIRGRLVGDDGSVVSGGELVVLQPGGDHPLTLASGKYVLRFDIERHSGAFQVVVEQLSGGAWSPVKVTPTKFGTTPRIERRARFSI